MPRDLRAHGSPQPEPRLLPSDPYTSPRGGDVVSHLVTLLSPEWARYPLPQHCSLSPTRVLAGTRQEHSYTRVSRRRGTPPPARPTRARSFSYRSQLEGDSAPCCRSHQRLPEQRASKAGVAQQNALRQILFDKKGVADSIDGVVIEYRDAGERLRGVRAFAGGAGASARGGRPN